MYWYSAQKDKSGLSAAPHPNTIDLARRSIDEPQTRQLSCAPFSLFFLKLE